jgi:hypothetical protein
MRSFDLAPSSPLSASRSSLDQSISPTLPRFLNSLDTFVQAVRVLPPHSALLAQFVKDGRSHFIYEVLALRAIFHPANLPSPYPCRRAKAPTGPLSAVCFRMPLPPLDSPIWSAARIARPNRSLFTSNLLLTTLFSALRRSQLRPIFEPAASK